MTDLDRWGSRSIGEALLLPQTPTELDDFVASLVEEFGIPAGDDTVESVATAIMHLPQTSAHTSRSYIADYVRKSLANLAAYTRLRDIAARRKAEEEKKKAELTLVPKEPDVNREQPIQNT